jgi:paraquat-inducible protein B
MMKKCNVTFIGAFVLGAVILVVIGVAALGAGRIFTRHPMFVMYFRGSAKGLDTGASVVFKGVKVGKVTNIELQYDPAVKSVLIVVLAEINLNAITRSPGNTISRDFFIQLIHEGLKAQFQYQNFMTGQLLIDLDFYPKKPFVLVKSSVAYPQIPTVPSAIEELSKAFEKLPLEELAAKLARSVEGIERAANSSEFNKTLLSLRATLEEIRDLTENVNTNTVPVINDVRLTLRDSRKLLNDFDKRSASLLASMEKTAEAARSAVIQAQEAIKVVEHSGTKDSQLLYQLTQALEKVGDAADSLRALSDYLNRHPEALLRGKGAPDE